MSIFAIHNNSLAMTCNCCCSVGELSHIDTPQRLRTPLGTSMAACLCLRRTYVGHITCILDGSSFALCCPACLESGPIARREWQTGGPDVLCTVPRAEHGDPCRI